MVRGRGGFFLSGFSGAYVHLSIGLATVGINHFAIETLAKLDSQRCLSHCRGANYCDAGNRVFRHVGHCAAKRVMRLFLSCGDGNGHLDELVCLQRRTANQATMDAILGAVITGVTSIHAAAVK